MQLPYNFTSAQFVVELINRFAIAAMRYMHTCLAIEDKRENIRHNESQLPHRQGETLISVVSPSVAAQALNERIENGGFAISLSGGGHRATLATLGALMAIVDRGLSPKVMQIASVSGGSITNAFVAQRCRFGELAPGELDEIANELTTTIIHNGCAYQRLDNCIASGTGLPRRRCRNNPSFVYRTLDMACHRGRRGCHSCCFHDPGPGYRVVAGSPVLSVRYSSWR